MAQNAVRPLNGAGLPSPITMAQDAARRPNGAGCYRALE